MSLNKIIMPKCSYLLANIKLISNLCCTLSRSLVFILSWHVYNALTICCWKWLYASDYVYLARWPVSMFPSHHYFGLSVTYVISPLGPGLLLSCFHTCHGRAVMGALSRARCHGRAVTGALSRARCHGRAVTGALSRARCHGRAVTGGLSRAGCHGRAVMGGLSRVHHYKTCTRMAHREVFTWVDL